MKKTMKKSMLVTTVLMVLLLIVALSTATFAWYTAQNNVKVNETLVTSAASSSAALVIDEAKALSSGSQSEVTITMSGAIDPAILDMTEAPTAGETAMSAFVYKTYTVTSAGAYASVPSTTQVSKITSVQGKSSSAQTQDSFWVTNVGGIATGVEATVTINPNYYAEKTVAENASVNGLYTKSGETYTKITDAEAKAEAGTTYYELKANSFLRVAMFVDDVYVGVWAADTANKGVKWNNFTAETTAEVGAAPAGHSSFDATVSGTAVNVKGSLASMGGIEVKLLAWFEGDSHSNAFAGTGSLFSVTFNGVTAA